MAEGGSVDVENRHIERASAQVVNQKPFFFWDFFRTELALHPVEAKRDGRGGRFVDDVDHVETGEPARVLGRFPTHFVAKKAGTVTTTSWIGPIRCSASSLMRFSRNALSTLRRNFVAVHLTVIRHPPDVPLKTVGKGVRLDHRALERFASDDDQPILESDRTWRQHVPPQLVGDGDRSTGAVNIGKRRERRAKVDSNWRL